MIRIWGELGSEEKERIGEIWSAMEKRVLSINIHVNALTVLWQGINETIGLQMKAGKREVTERFIPPLASGLLDYR